MTNNEFVKYPKPTSTQAAIVAADNNGGKQYKTWTTTYDGDVVGRKDVSPTEAESVRLHTTAAWSDVRTYLR